MSNENLLLTENGKNNFVDKMAIFGIFMFVFYSTNLLHRIKKIGPNGENKTDPIL